MQNPFLHLCRFLDLLMIEIVHHDERCIERTPDAVIIAERETAGYNPVTIANQIPRSITSGN